MNDDEASRDGEEASAERSQEPSEGRDGQRDEQRSATDPSTSEEEWQFTLEDIERREAEAKAEAEARERRGEPIEPGDPSLEGTAFVLLGVIFTLFVLSRLLVG